MSNQYEKPSQPPQDTPERRTGPLNAPPEPSKPASPVPPTNSEKPPVLIGSPSDTLIAATKEVAKAGGQPCPKCGFVNRPGVLVCENCGTLLINGEQSTVGTKQFDREKKDDTQPKPSGSMETAELVSMVSTAGSTQFSENMVLRLEVEGAPTPILLTPKTEMSIGRRDPATGTMPDIDLSIYAGYRLGVSRKHAVIRLKNHQLELYDLGSSNGTSVNGVRLTAHQPQMLRDGDEIMLGKMSVRVLFQSKNRRK